MLVDTKRPFFWILVFFILSLVGIIIFQLHQNFLEKNTVIIYTGAGAVRINIEYATTPEEWQKGFMNRSSLRKNSGMLFIFPEEETREFWMKSVLIPLDLMFISSNGRINEITTLEPCTVEESQCPSYNSKFPSKYVIEVNAGFVTQNQILEGDILGISGF
jgi:hypothetical protein